MTATAGAKFRARVAGALDLGTADPVWLGLLDEVTAALDVEEQLAARIERDGYVIAGSRAQPVLNPLVSELRLQRVATSRLMERLGTSPDQSFHDAQRRAADARWRR